MARTARTRAALAAAGVGIGAIVVVGAHDTYSFFDRQIGALCERQDGSFWRGPSGCEAHNDPNCTGGISCSDSLFVAEPPRSTCGWVYAPEDPATGEPPFRFETPPVDGGCYVN